MAEPAACRQALIRIGFIQATAEAITDAEGQNISTFTEFALLTDSQAESLCKTLRRPGGTIPNPGAAPPAHIPNPGHVVSLRAENNLKLMCYYIRHKGNTGRNLVWADVTLEGIRSLLEFRNAEDKHEDPSAPTITGNDWPKNIDTMEEYLRGCRGTTGLPLAYVIRAEEQVVATADDPAANYSNPIEELIARAPILNPVDGIGYLPTFVLDRAKVWELLSAIGRDKEWWTYLRVGQRARDGRLAFLRVRGHYLGVNNVDNMATSAETKLQNATYRGEGRRYNFEKYVRIHVEQHTVLEGLVQHGYTGIDVRSKVRYLMNGIKTKELDATKTRIMSDENLRTNFDLSVNLIKDYIKHNGNLRSGKEEMTISGMDANSEDADMSVEDRYYKKSEYSQLSAGQKLGLQIKRKRRGGDGKAKGKPSGPSKKKIKAIEAQVEKRVISALSGMLNSEDDDNDESSADDNRDDESEKIKLTRNRINKALKEKKRKA